MSLFVRFVARVICLLLVPGVGVSLAALPASATVSKLCTGNVACVRAGMSDSGYWFNSKTMYWRMYSGHNCTNYAAYRIIQNGGPASRPWTGSGNATNWGVAMSRITDSTPTVGSIAWWRAGVKPAGSAGHVAYVERVVSADEIIVSQDSWGGDFSWARITRSGGGWPSGFIHFNDVPLLNTTAPKVSGTAKVGSVLTASPGAWSAGATYAYQWTQDGADIPGAKAATLALTQAMQGRRIAVRVTASAQGYRAATVASAPTTAVGAGALDTSAAPTIVGTSTVDATLTARPGTWDPTPDSLGYQWRADGVPVPGATQPTFRVGVDQVGAALSVTVTATKAGYADVSRTSSATSPVTASTLAFTRAPALTGLARPGRLLRLTKALTTPAAALQVQWLRAGRPVPGATGSSYRVTAADLGSRVSAEVRATKAGYGDLVRRTPSTAVVRATPTIQVSPQPGPGTLAFTASVRVAGAPVDGKLHVRSRGRLLAVFDVRDGAARGTVTGLPRTKRVYRFWFARTTTATRGVVARRLTLR